PGPAGPGDRLGQHRAVVGQDATPLDLQLVQERAHIERVVLKFLSLDDGPASRPHQKKPEQDDQEGEEAQDGRVHALCLTSSRSAPPGALDCAAGLRARSETSSTSATSTKLAM